MQRRMTARKLTLISLVLPHFWRMATRSLLGLLLLVEHIPEESLKASSTSDRYNIQEDKECEREELHCAIAGEIVCSRGFRGDFQRRGDLKRRWRTGATCQWGCCCLSLIARSTLFVCACLLPFCPSRRAVRLHRSLQSSKSTQISVCHRQSRLDAWSSTQRTRTKGQPHPSPHLETGPKVSLFCI